MRILGLVTGIHDTGVALIEDGIPKVIIEEERLNRKKHTRKFPQNAIRKMFEETDINLEDIDAITIPWDTAQLRQQVLRLLKNGFPNSVNLLRETAFKMFNSSLLFAPTEVNRQLRKLFPGKTIPPIKSISHHDAHAAFFYVSPFEDATVLVMDGIGDQGPTSVYEGNGDELTLRQTNSFTDSLGIVYTLVSQYLGFGYFGDEGKVMGLSAYGQPTYVEKFRDIIKCLDNGEYRVNMEYFSYQKYGQLKPFTKKFYETFGPERHEDDELTQRHKDIAYALQIVLEETILHIVKHLHKQYPSQNLCLAGGVAMNCVAMARILRDSPYKKIWLPPCASDTGAPLGSALWHYHHDQGHSRHYEIKHAFWGAEYNDQKIEKALEEGMLNYERLEEKDLIDRVSDDLMNGKIIGWYQGRFEMGPRALGNRSILADPRRSEMKATINAKIKEREAFRPFAPAVLYECASEYFDINQPDPFMTIAPKVHIEKTKEIPAVVHIDNTARIQTVQREANPRYYDLIKTFGQKTGVPILLNTSFNKQEPIVASPEEAISCYLRTSMDVLVLGNYYVTDRNLDALLKVYRQFL